MLRSACWLPLTTLVALVACTALPANDGGPVPALLLGEQHDVAEHQQFHLQTVDALVNRQALAALVLEMAEGGRSTIELAPSASEAQVREALAWDGRAWPWAAYGPAVMSAVRGGVPVHGANLSAQQMRAAMADARFDLLLPDAALRAQREAMRTGHCNLLPESQLPAMARVQVARDEAMARTIARVMREGKTVVLLAGAGHVDTQLGVPVHLAASRVRADAVVLPQVDTGKDYCAEFRRSRTAPAGS